MDFEPPVPTEEEDIEQALKDIDCGCCLGEASYEPTGEIFRRELMLFRESDGSSCFDIPKELLDRMISEGRLTFEVEQCPQRSDLWRRVYRLTTQTESK
jgi:hypothetical protein